MLGGIFIFIISIGAAYAMIGQLARKYPFLDADLLKKMFWYHILLTLAYFGYIATARSIHGRITKR